MKNLIVVTVAASILVACASLTLSERIYVACSGYTSALGSLAVHKRAGRLSTGDTAKVDAVRPTMRSLCNATSHSPADLDVIETGVKSLIGLKRQADGS